MADGDNFNFHQSSDRIKLNVGGKLFETTAATLRSGNADSLLAALSNRPLLNPAAAPVFIDRDPDIFSVLISLLRTNRLPSTAKRFTNHELIDEASYYGIEPQLRSALAPARLAGIDASLFTTITPASDGVVSALHAIDSDGSVWFAHAGQISIYDWNLDHTATVRTHMDRITSIRRVRDGVAAIGSDAEAGIHFYNALSGCRIGSAEWTDESDPRVYKARVAAITDSADTVCASFECTHSENCLLLIDKSTLKVVSELGRQSGSSSKNMAAGKLKYLPERGVLVGSAVSSGAFGFSGYIRLWDPRCGKVVWETTEPGSGRSSRFGDPFADVDVDADEAAIFKVCSKSGDLARADLRKLSEDPWVYLEEKNPTLKKDRSCWSGGVIRCYRRQVFVGREGELEVWSRVEKGGVGDEIECGKQYRRNGVDRLEDSDRGIIHRMEGGGDRLFVTREGVDGIQVWQSSNSSDHVSIL